eukprot:SAG11_NODE_137_length_15114_cov_2.297303_8_plen_1246_part_00
MVVEQQHAYLNLDLPLLNRFEKQILIADTMLSEVQKLLLADLQEWVEAIRDETVMSSYQSIFCGYHDQTLPSLILSSIPSGESGIALSENLSMKLDEMKEALCAVAMPAAVLQSQLLQVTSRGIYFETHASIHTVLQAHFGAECSLQHDSDQIENMEPSPEVPDSVGEPAGRTFADSILGVVLTQSPSSHMHQALCAHESSDDARLCGALCQTMAMSDISSEGSFARAIRRFFRDERELPLCLLINADPLRSAQVLINHARHICSQQREQFEVEIGDCLRPPRHIVFVIHLPPGVINKDRHFMLDFYAPWVHVFVDDLRPSADMKTYDMLSKPLSALTNVNENFISNLMERKCHSLASRVLQPQIDDQLYSQRINLVKTLAVDSLFLSAIVDLTSRTLEVNDDVGISGLHAQAEVALGTGAKGSLRQSLELAIEQCVERAVAHVLRHLDINCNLRLIISSRFRDLWFLMASSSIILDKDTISRGCDLALNDTSGEVQNTGKGYGPLLAQFPHSSRVISALETIREAVRDTIGSESEFGEMRAVAAQMHAATVAMFGADMMASWDTLASSTGEHLYYLHDFVASIPHNVSGLTLRSHCTLVACILRSMSEDSLKSLPSVHSYYWQAEEQINTICCVIGAFQIPDVVQKFEAALSKLIQPDIKMICACAVGTALDLLWLELHASSADALQIWTCRLEKVRGGLEILLADSYKGIGDESYGEIWLQKSNELNGLRTVSIFLQEVPMEVLRCRNQIDLQSIAHGFQRSASEPGPPHILLGRLCRGFRRSPDFFTEFCTFLLSFHANALASKMSDVLRRFITSVLFASTAVGCSIEAEVELVNQLFSIVEGVAPNGVDDANWLNLLNVSLRRSVLQCLMRLPRELHFSHNAITKPSGLELLLEYMTDKCESGSELSLDVLRGLPSQHISEMAGTSQVVEYVERIVSSQCHVRNYVLELMASQADDAEAAEGVFITSRDVIETGNLIAAKTTLSLYATKLAVWVGGPTFVFQLGSLPDAGSVVPWLRFDHAAIAASIKNDMIDPFRSWENSDAGQEHFADLATAFQLRNISKIDAAVRQMKWLRRENLPMVAAAIYTHVLQETPMVHDSHVLEYKCSRYTEPQLLELLTLKNKYHIRSESSKVIRWVAFGCPLSIGTWLDRRFAQGRAPVHQVIFHASLLAWQQPTSWAGSLLFRPLDLNDTFVPTMPVDDMSLVMAGLANSGLRWYRCPRGHPYVRNIFQNKHINTSYPT